MHPHHLVVIVMGTPPGRCNSSLPLRFLFTSLILGVLEARTPPILSATPKIAPINGNLIKTIGILSNKNDDHRWTPKTKCCKNPRGTTLEQQWGWREFHYSAPRSGCQLRDAVTSLVCFLSLILFSPRQRSAGEGLFLCNAMMTPTRLWVCSVLRLAV